MTFADKTERDVNATIALDLKNYSRRRWPLANDKYRKSRLAGLLNLSARRIKSLWEGSPGAVIREHEADAVRRLTGLKIEEANRHDFQALQERVAVLEARLAAVDEEFHQPQMAAFGQAVDGRRGRDVAVAALTLDERRRHTSIDDPDIDNAD